MTDPKHEPQPAGYQRRLKWQMTEQPWVQCSTREATDMFNRSPSCEYRPIYTIEALTAQLDALKEERGATRLMESLKTPFCVLFLDGRNEHGAHVIASYPRSFEAVDNDVTEQAEAILEAAENAGFQSGQHVWAEFAWVAPQIGDEGRVELDGYWDFRWINEEMTRAALTQPQLPESGESVEGGEWKRVPVDPTPEMQKAGFDALGPDRDCNCDQYDCYSAMINAAPTKEIP